MSSEQCMIFTLYTRNADKLGLTSTKIHMTVRAVLKQYIIPCVI